MNINLFLLIIVVITALAFDFTNGFHDTGNAMATSIASGALKPKAAVALSAVLNLVGAFMSTAVAATIAKGLIEGNIVTLELVFAGLVGGIVWNLLTWLFGIPSSSSHALIGGIVGATIAAVGAHGVIWKSIVSKVIIPAVVAAILAVLVGAIATWLVYRITRGVPEKRSEAGFRYGQWGSASLVSLAHGTGDAQKTMGIIFLALMSYGAVSKNESMPPFWVILCCAIAMAMGTYLGGWRIIRTLGKGLVEIKSPQGMAAESSSAAVILLSTHFGYALSTTQVCTGSVLGSGLGKPGGEVRWGVAGRMVTAWLITLPAAGLVGAITYWIVHLIGGYPGAIIGFSLLVAVSATIYIRSRRVKVDHKNVNEDWEGSLTAGLDGRREHAAVRHKGSLRRRHRERGERLMHHGFSDWFNYQASLKILLFSMLAGAALPGLFALGLRLQAVGSGHVPAATAAHRSATRCCWRLALLIYALVVAVILFALLYISRDFIAHHTRHALPGSQTHVASRACWSTRLPNPLVEGAERERISQLSCLVVARRISGGHSADRHLRGAGPADPPAGQRRGQDRGPRTDAARRVRRCRHRCADQQAHRRAAVGRGYRTGTCPVGRQGLAAR